MMLITKKHNAKTAHTPVKLQNQMTPETQMNREKIYIHKITQNQNNTTKEIKINKNLSAKQSIPSNQNSTISEK